MGAARRWADTANDERIGGDGRRLAGMKGAQNIAQDGGLASGIHISPGARPPPRLQMNGNQVSGALPPRSPNPQPSIAFLKHPKRPRCAPHQPRTPFPRQETGYQTTNALETVGETHCNPQTRCLLPRPSTGPVSPWTPASPSPTRAPVHPESGPGHLLITGTCPGRPSRAITSSEDCPRLTSFRL